MPVLVTTTALTAVERVVAVSCGAYHGLALAAAPPLPLAATLAASAIGDTGATLNASACANGAATSVTFEYGLSTVYGTTLAGSPANLTGTATAAIGAALSGLIPNTIYHYRVVASGPGGVQRGADMTFATTDVTALRRLFVSGASVWPAFSSGVTGYFGTAAATSSAISLTPVVRALGATVTVNGVAVISGTASAALPLVPGNNPISVVVAANGQTRTYTLTVTRLPETCVFDSPGSVPVSVGGLVASGQRLAFALNYAPAVGTNLTVVRNAGNGFIQGAFDNLAQGQAVNLAFGGLTYRFVANYYGGSGNDLVLQWASNRVLAWGAGSSGQLGNNRTTGSSVPVAVDRSGVLAATTVLSLKGGSADSFALCADGNVASWGDGMGLGNATSSSSTNALVPVTVSRTGVLLGKTIAAVSAGTRAGSVLCADGSLALWGTGGTGGPSIPVLLGMPDALADKTLVKLVQGTGHTLGLCSDGTLLAWGSNSSGQLGNGSTTTSSTAAMVMVDRTGVLAGKSVIAVAAGGSHSYALCADGTLAAWGSNGYGQLGDGTTIQRNVPVLVTRAGVLAGKTVVELAGGASFGLARCADGALAAWGYNYYGQLGDGSQTTRTTPVLVNQTGVLSGKSVSGIFAGDSHALVLCADGTLAAWGYNGDGELGNNSVTASSVPVLVSTAAIGVGEQILACAAGSVHNLMLVATPPPPAASTLAAIDILDLGATLHGSVDPQGAVVAARFEYGLTNNYGSIVAANPASVSGSRVTAVSANLGGLQAGVTYHYRAVAENPGGVARGADFTFTTSTFASLANLTLSDGALVPVFSREIANYLVSVPNATSSLRVTPTCASATATVTVNGVAVASGTPSAALALTVGSNPLSVLVAAADGINATTYTINVVRLPASFTFAAATTVPLTVGDLVASGPAPPLVLGFAPVPGTQLTVVNNSGPRPIAGAFGNLTQGQTVSLAYNGVSYPFVVNYFGGKGGNDLVLQWGNTRVFAWGNNNYGQIGNGSPSGSSPSAPVPVYQAGVLAGKTVTSIGAGGMHSVALCADGSVATWGYNSAGRLGDGTSVYQSGVPVLVNRTGVLAGKLVVAMAVGDSCTLVLCSDGTLAAWGSNASGQLGDNSFTDRPLPVLVDRTGVLAGKVVVAIAGGTDHNLALCADGTLAAWGANTYGQLGNNSLASSTVPVLVSAGGVLAGKSVTAISAGGTLSLALCSDGTVAAWGLNSNGQLGNGTTANSSVPLLVTSSGVLAGKTVTAVSAGSAFGLALCADGTLATWGNGYALGNGGTTTSNVPVLVTRSGVLAGKTVTTIAAGSSYALVGCADGFTAAWGVGSYGQLGDGTTSFNASSPVACDISGLAAGERFMAVTDGAGYSFSLGIVASPPPPLATTLAATAVTDSGATLNASVQANASTTSLSFEYGLTTAYGTTVAGSPASVSGTGSKAVSYRLDGLPPGVTYHYRLVASNGVSTVRGDDMTFTLTTDGTLAGLTLDQGLIAPGFDVTRTDYVVTVAFATTSIRVTPVTSHAEASVKVNNVATASGSATAPIALPLGNTPIAVVATSGDGSNSKTYQIVVTRLPETFNFSSAAMVQVTAGKFAAAGNAPAFFLTYQPQAGSALTVVNNTGSEAILGRFDNLAQGQTVNLAYQGIIYPFVADYYGGSGNDLVLRWGSTRIWGWGDNSAGQLGNGTTVNATVPTPASASGVLAGRTVTTVSGGDTGCLAICADGSLVGLGGTSNGYTAWLAPVGVLAGHIPHAIARGTDSPLILCEDGTLASWGGNYYGQLGDGSATDKTAPVLVDRSGVLAGKTITAMGAGTSFRVVLCSDGTLATWGRGDYGQLGNGTSPSGFSGQTTPVLVIRSGVLAGKTVSALAAGSAHCLVLCTDGTLVSWGYNSDGELGNGTASGYSGVSTPVLVDRSGVLAGKTVTAISAGGTHCLVKCSDGTLATWGSNSYGQLGNGGTTASAVPVLVNRSGALAGKNVTQLFAGNYHNLVICDDGTFVTWGGGSSGQLGNGTTANSSVPVLVDLSGLAAGDRIVTDAHLGMAGSSNYIVVAVPPAASTATLAVTDIGDGTATLRGTLRPNGVSTNVTFEYGLTSAYGWRVAADGSPVTGSGDVAVQCAVDGLQPGAVYHYRVVVTNRLGTSIGDDITFTTTALSTLADLVPGEGLLMPAFSPAQNQYAVTVPAASTGITLTPTLAQAGATVRVAGEVVASGNASQRLELAPGNTEVAVDVTAAGGLAVTSYTVTVTRLPEQITFGAATGDGLVVSGMVASGAAPVLTLNFAPGAGTDLLVVNNTGPGFIRGAFADLAQGQRVVLEYGGLFYPFVVNYFGGDGNDLVLQWQAKRLLAWGNNNFYVNNLSGELGIGNSNVTTVPTPVLDSGLFAARSFSTMAGASGVGVAVCPDGTLSYWGQNIGSSIPAVIYPDNPRLPVGKTVVAIGAGSSYAKMLCADGSLLGWGSNSSGQLGNIGTAFTPDPLVISGLGALASKRVVGITAYTANYAWCEDGSVFTLGGGMSTEPAVFGTGTVLEGRKVVKLARGSGFALALCADGGLVAWGVNTYGELGSGTKSASSGPVAVTMSGVLAGKSVTAIAAGGNHSVVLCSDGSVAVWGYNTDGRLGDGSSVDQTVPVLFKTSGVLAGKTVVKVGAGAVDIYVLCADGTLVAAGTNPSVVPIAALAPGERVTGTFHTNDMQDRFAVVAKPLGALAETLAATTLSDTAATLNAEAFANGTHATLAFEYGLTNAYGTSVDAEPAAISGIGRAEIAASIDGLVSGTTYHFRVKTTDPSGVSYGRDLTFTTGDQAGLAGLALSAGSLSPAFDSHHFEYSVTLPFSSTATTVSASVAHAAAVVTINGSAGTAGAASETVALAVGVTTIPVVVTAADGISNQTFIVRVARVPETFVYQTGDEVPLTVDNFSADGLSLDLHLAYAPLPGTQLMVIKNTGPGFIQGRFTNLAQGQRLEWLFEGIAYPFVVNYFGGSGNDLVLQWGNTKVLAWGRNLYGQLGDNTTVTSLLPLAVDVSGALGNRSPTSVAARGNRALALAVDGTLAQWGNSASAGGTVPVALASGLVGARQIVQVAAGTNHSVALCADGSLVAWGSNPYGELGNGTTVSTILPAQVDMSGVLAGRTVVAVAVGTNVSYALCADGSVASWGYSQYGQLGTVSVSYITTVPVMVDAGGVLANRRIIALEAGVYHCLALCDDGALVAWGYNSKGQLGNNSIANSSVPVLVDTSGVLAGKTVTALAAGSEMSLVLCDDGTLAAWGSNQYGQLGNGSSVANSTVAVAVDQSGWLAGKTVVGISAGPLHLLARCADGTLAGWGYNATGQLGNNSTVDSHVPTPAAASATLAGGRMVQAGAADGFTTALIALPPSGAATTLAASAIVDAAATLHASVLADGSPTPVRFEYGLTPSYGLASAADPAVVTGVAAVPLSARVSGLLPGTTYHFRVVADAPGGTVRGVDLTFTTTTVGALAGLTISAGGLSPVFEPTLEDYILTVPGAATEVVFTPVVFPLGAAITVNGVATLSGVPSAPVALSSDVAAVVITVDAGDGVNAKTYRITVNRLPAVLAFDAATTVSAEAERFNVTGQQAALELHYAPQPGTLLTVLRSTGREPILGNFTNLAQGQQIVLEYAGMAYRMVANYYGGSGNDLVLQWADLRLLGWGGNSNNQLPGWSGSILRPVSLDFDSVLAGRSMLAVDCGNSHALALLSDGAVMSWGGNSNGQLGRVSGSVGMVDASGVLAGRRVVQIVAGSTYSLALCDDGSVVMWGVMGSVSSWVDIAPLARPQLVAPTGALAGRRVIRLATGSSTIMALCADGAVVTWGSSTTSLPVLVDRSGALKDKQVVTMASGTDMSFVLCADGSLAGWGTNSYGSVGNNSTVSQSTPVLINGFGALAGKPVVAISCGQQSCLALAADGTLVAWGDNSVGELGQGTTTGVYLPTWVSRVGALADKTVVALASGTFHSACLTSDGSLAAWGDNYYGELGINSTSNVSLPNAVITSAVRQGERIIGIKAAGYDSLAIVAMPPQPVVETLTATAVADASATLQGSVRPNDLELSLAFEYGLTTSYGTVVAATPDWADALVATASQATLSGLLPGTTYHYRALATSSSRVLRGADRTLTTGIGAALAGLTPSAGALLPSFSMAGFAYACVVPYATATITLTPQAGAPGSIVRVDGAVVAAGSACAPVSLAVGNNAVTVVVSSASGAATNTYVVTVTRMPEVFRFNTADDVPVTAAGFAPSGMSAQFALGFAPLPGTRLTIVRNTGASPINGTFANLRQNQLVELSFNGTLYRFVADYRGGSGKDLVLEWASNRLMSWGNGQKVPIAADTTGALYGQSVTQVAAGANHQLAVLADGTLFAWGSNSYGQIGTSDTTSVTSPARINAAGVLAGKQVVAVAAGPYHSLALCADGSLAAWGNNSYGQLGSGDSSNSKSSPVAVDQSGVLAGKRVVALAATVDASLALCDDGAVAAWGLTPMGCLATVVILTVPARSW